MMISNSPRPDTHTHLLNSILMMLLATASVLYAAPDLQQPIRKDYDTGHTNNDQACGLTPEAQQLARLVINDIDQHRRKLSCNVLLAEAASIKARDMATSGLISHFGRGGANQRLRDVGYPLSMRYPSQFANHVESVSGNSPNAIEAWKTFKASKEHRLHLLGEHPFFRQQNEIGVGHFYSPDSVHEHYWVIYIANRD